MQATETQDEQLETEDSENYLTEEERAAIEEQEDEFDRADDARRMSAFSRGCLEVAGAFAILAALLILLEKGAGLCFGYGLPQFFLPLCCAAGSLMALTTCLFSMLRKGLAAFFLINTLWFVVLLYCVTNYQFPEVIPTTLPEVGQPVVLTQITTPIGVNLCIDEEILPGVLSKRFKVPVHPKYIPLHHQVELTWSEEYGRVLLHYNGKLWAVYDPEKKKWTDTLHSGIRTEETEETETTEETKTSTKTSGTTTTSRKSKSRQNTTTAAKNED